MADLTDFCVRAAIYRFLADLLDPCHVRLGLLFTHKNLIFQVSFFNVEMVSTVYVEADQCH